MANRKLRIVKRNADIPVLGVCERCNAQFAADPHKLGELTTAERSISEQFNAHICKPVDSSQNALRIVREATEKH
jgi:hypothetical protein